MAANLQIQIDPPTQGAQQTERDFQRVAAAATAAHKAVQSGSGASQSALVGVHGTAIKTAGGFDALQAAVSRNASAAGFLVRTIGPLGGGVALMASRVERAALIMESMTGAVSSHTSKQTILNQAFQQGAIAAATMEAALVKVTQTTEAAQAAVARYAQAQAAVAAAQRAVQQSAILVGQRRLDVFSTAGGGDTKAEAMAARDLSAAQAGAVESQVALRQAMLQAAPLKAQAAALTREQAEAEKVFASATAAFAISMGAVIGVITGAIAVLVALAAALYAVKKAFDEGLKLDQQIRGLEALTGSVKIARETYEGFVDTARTTKFEIPDLVRAYQELYTFRRAGIDTAQTLKDMAVLTAGPIGNLDGLVNAFDRVQETGRTTERTLRSFMNAGVDLSGILSNYLHKSTTQVITDLRNGSVSLEVISRAMHAAAADGGYFSQVMAYMGASAQQQIKRMRTDWNELFAEFGKPLNPALAAMFGAIADSLEKAIPQARALGEQIGHVLNALTLIAKEKGWTTAFEVAWQLTVDNMVATLASMFASAFLRLGPAMADAFWEGWKSRIANLFGGDANIFTPIDQEVFTKTLLKNMVIDPTTRATLEKQLGGSLTDIWTNAWNRTTGGAAGAPTLPKPGAAPPPPKQTHDITKDFAGDLRTLIDYWQKYNEIQAFSTDAESRHYHQMKLLEQTIKELGDPIRDVEKLLDDPGLSPTDRSVLRWEAWREAADRSINDAELRMKAGVASMDDVFRTGIQKMVDGWGSWQTQASNAIGEVGNALVSNLSSGFTDILTGTKSISQGFHDMALSLINDIERIILKMLIQLAIQQLLAGFGGSSGAVASAFGPQMAGLGLQSGGTVAGSGRGDKVHAMLEPGEFVIPRDQAQKFGYGRLEQIRHMQDGGTVRGYAQGGSITAYNPGGGPLEGGFFGAGPFVHTPLQMFGQPGVGSRDDPISLALGPNSNYHFGQYVPLNINGTMYWGQIQDFGPKVKVLDVAVSGKYANWAHSLPAGAIRLGGFGPSRLAPGSNPFGNPRASGFRTGAIGDPDVTRLGFRDPGFTMKFDSFEPYGTDLGPMGGYDRPGLPNFNATMPGSSVVVPLTTPQYETAPGAYTGLAPSEFIVNGVGYAPSADPARPGFIITRGPNAGTSVPEIPGSTSGSPVAIPTSRGLNLTPSPSVGSPFSDARLLPGATFGLGSFASGSIESIGGKLFHGMWSGRKPFTAANFRNYQSNWNYNLGALSASMGGSRTNTFSYANYLAQWNASRSMGLTNALGGGSVAGIGIPAGHKQYHQGGVVDAASAYASGGVVRANEGVFTPDQMRALGPSGDVNTSNVVVNVNINSGGGSSTDTQGGGLSAEQGRAIAQAIPPIVLGIIGKERRGGGSLYVSRAQRGG